MKKTFFTIIMIGCLPFIGYAQTPEFGVKAGLSLTSAVGGNSSGNSYKLGFNGGLMANFRLSDAISLQPEILYSIKGTKATDAYTISNPNPAIPSTTITGTTTSNLHYLDIPVLVHVKVDRIFFEIGPQIGFLLAAQTKQEIPGQPTSSNNTTEGLHTLDFGYVGGVGLKLIEHLSVGLRYNGGLRSISQQSGSNLVNSAFQLYAAYSFGTK